MTTRVVSLLVLALAVPLHASAQVAASTPAPAVAPVAAQPAQAPQAPAAAPAPRNRTEARQEMMEAQRQRAVEQAAERQSKGVNVKIDATVIEYRGAQVTGRKELTLTIVDGEWGSVRSSQQVFNRTKMGSGYRTSPLNMDARAFLRDDGKVKVALTLEYRGVPADTTEEPAGENATFVQAGAMDDGIKQNVTVVLESGKPLVVAQSADAVGDRRVALEVKATVLK